MEEDALYEPRREFNYVKMELSTLQRMAQQFDNENGGGQDGFGNDPKMLEE